MYLCRCTDSETALRIVSALRWRNVRKSQSFERVSNSHSLCAPSNAALDFSFFLASQFCTTYGEICSTEKRVCLFECNVGNVQTIDTERTCRTSQIFAVVDFAKHRPGMRRLHLRHWGNIRQYSQGSIATPSTPQLEQLSAISETIEQKRWERVKYRNSSLTTALLSHAKLSLVWIMWPASSLLLAYYFCEKIASIQTKKTSLTIAVRCLWKRWWWWRKISLWWKCRWGVVFWNTQNYIDSRCVVNRNK